MVKVQDEPAMAESKSAAVQQSSNTTSNSSNGNATHVRKMRTNHSHSHHLHQTFHHYTYYHHHCTYTTENADGGATKGGGSGGGSPARFYFGPGFEPQAQIPGGSFAPSTGQVQNSPEYVVLFHVNPGVTISFQIGDNLEVLRGPVTVPMVSTNSSPPIAMPVQVPPGHVVQQIVDESGTLRHVILSPQHQAGLVPLSSHNSQNYGAGPPNASNQAQQFYQGLPSNFPPQHFHSNLPSSHSIPNAAHLGHSPPPLPNQSYYKDERAQKQHIKLKKKLQDKQQQKGDGVSPRKDLINGLKRSTVKEKGMNSVGTSEDGEESSVLDEEDSVQLVADILSSVQAPKVSELSSRSALLQWASPTRLSETVSSDGQEIDISESDLRYEVLLSDKGKEMKFKSIYNGTALSCRIQDLKPGQEYSVCLQVHLDELQGSATDPIKFATPPCEPDQPQPPKLHRRFKNALHLRWNPVSDNGSHITHYVLEYDEGKGGEFIEFHRGRAKQHTIQKLQPSTSYKFRLCAVNEIGKSLYSDVVIYNTCSNVPPKPEPPAVEEIKVHSLHLRWERRAMDDEFKLQMGDVKNNRDYLTVYAGEDTQHVCSRLLPSTEYKFRLCTQNDGGVSPWSDEIVYSTLPDRPSRPSKPVVKDRIRAHGFKLKWEPPSDTGGAEITRYILEINSGSGYEIVYSGSETEAVCDKLIPGTTYQLRVSCISAGGSSNYSDPCTVTTEATQPGQCAAPKLVGKARSNAVTIRWCESDYNGGAPVLEYELNMVYPDSSRRLVHKKETECTIADLSPGRDYLFAVRAVNRIGPGTFSDYLKVTTASAPPEAPLTPVATCKSPFHIVVDWREPTCNGAPILEYKLEMSCEEIEEKFSTVYQGAESNCDMKSLSPFTKYYFRVQACNIAGCSPFSPIADTLTPAAPPAAVTSIRSEVTPTSIKLNWSEPHNNGAPITHYIIDISDRLIITENSITQYLIDSLHPDTHYKIKIQAVNDVGSGLFSSTYRTATLRLPPVAPKLECVGFGHNYLKLKWGEGKNAEYTQYCIEMENPRSREFQCVYKGTALTYKVNKLQELTKYKFRINATNDAGSGEFSEEYQFETRITPPAMLKSPKLVEIEQRSCAIEWLPGKNSFSDPVIYQVQICKVKDQIYKQVFKGSESKCIIEDLEPSTDYSTRVSPIRISPISGELPGPYSPPLNFSTVSPDLPADSKSSAVNSSSSSHSHRHKRFLLNYFNSMRPMTISDQPVFYAVLLMIIGITISMWIMSFL